MKRLAVILAAMSLIGTSQANTSLNGKELFGRPTTIESPAQIAIKKGPVLARSIKIQKPKIFTGNPHKIVLFADDSEDNIIEVDDIITSYRRKDLQRIQTDPTPDDPEGLITEEIRWKLFLARTAAMIRYHQIHS
jgi:hypothetical protein